MRISVETLSEYVEIISEITITEIKLKQGINLEINNC